MTPALLALSRAYLALPGAPVYSTSDGGWIFHTGERHAFRSATTGLLWFRDPDEPASIRPRDAWYVLDLTDAATGGVMLSLLPSGNDPERLTAGWLVHTGYGSPPSPGATLAEAVARAAVALGRAG